MSEKDEKKDKALAVNINLDTTPILYTERVFMSVNEYGLVLDITQKIGDKARIVARIGMSREHAKQLVKELAKLLMITEGSGKTKKN